MDTENINIKQEKSDDSYDITVKNKAKDLPKPITEVKQEQIVVIDNDQSRSINNLDIDDIIDNNPRIKEEKENDIDLSFNVQVSSENNHEGNPEENRGITPPRPIIIRKKSTDMDMDSDKNMIDDLTFLDDLNDNLDDIIPIVNEIPTITIEEDGEVDLYNDIEFNDEESIRRAVKREKSDRSEGESKRKKRKKKSKKRKSSHSPVDIKPNLKRLNESLGLPKELSDISDDEELNLNENDNESRFPRKVYNYNHSSVPDVLENIEKEQIPSISNSLKVKQERLDVSNEKSKIKARPPLPKKIKLEKVNESVNENNIEQVLKMCRKALKHLKVFKSKQNFHRFLYTPTKIVVPISTEEKEYRSPLLRSSQISFKYSSINPKIQYNEFNLESLSENITHVSRPLGLDVSKLKNWIQNFARNSYIKHKNEEFNKKPFESDNEIINLTTIHTSVSTQTIDIPCDVCLIRELRLNNHVGVMAKMEGKEISTQTTEEKKNELPILRILESLNANQLLALNDFTMLLCEQNWDSADASSRLNIRDKILQYFQEGQKPCNVPGIRNSTKSSQNQLQSSVAPSVSNIRNTQNRSMTNTSYQPSASSSSSILPGNAMYNNTNNPVGGVLVNTLYNNLTPVPQASQMGQYQFNPAIQMTNQRVFTQGVIENYGGVLQQVPQPVPAPVNQRNLNIPIETRMNDPRLNRMDPRYRQ